MEQKSKAFTLVELLVTIGLIMILMSITLVSLNIDKQFKSAREAKRSADVRVLLDSITQYNIDQKNNDVIPKDNVSRYLSNGKYKSKTSGDLVPVPDPSIDLCNMLVPKYIAQMPIDPLFDESGKAGTENCSNHHTGYMVTQTPEGRIIVSAPFSELGTVIAVR